MGTEGKLNRASIEISKHGGQQGSQAPMPLGPVGEQTNITLSTSWGSDKVKKIERGNREIKDFY